jgi:hypothetical protein
LRTDEENAGRDVGGGGKNAMSDIIASVVKAVSVLLMAAGRYLSISATVCRTIAQRGLWGQREFSLAVNYCGH